MRLIFILVAMVVAVVFAVQNATAVAVTVFFWRLEASLAVIIAVCFALGAVVAALAVMPGLYRRRSDARRLQAKIADLEAGRAPDRAADVAPDVTVGPPSSNAHPR